MEQNIDLTKRGTSLRTKTLLILCCPVVAFILFKYSLCLYYNFFTRVSDNLTAEQTLAQYFDFLEDGNSKGMAMISGNDCEWYNAFEFTEFLYDVELTNMEYAGEPTELMKHYGYAEGKVFLCEYKGTYNMPNASMEFVMCRETPDSPWRLAAMGGGYAGE